MHRGCVLSALEKRKGSHSAETQFHKHCSDVRESHLRNETHFAIATAKTISHLWFFRRRVAQWGWQIFEESPTRWAKVCFFWRFVK